MTLSTREVARGLSGYLCGTHSGVLALTSSGTLRRGGHSPKLLARAHQTLKIPMVPRSAIEIGSRIWRPDPGSDLPGALDAALAHAGVIDLVFFGSQATGRKTGFSDVDAILVIDDNIAESAETIAGLRRSVLAAQRAVIRHQPMQHHGFEVVTPKLLRDASSALALPSVALDVTRSLKGRTVTALFADDARGSVAALHRLVQSLLSVRRWPTHAWEAHRLIAMFELLPALYLQSAGKIVSKSSAFEYARAEFGESWWPYDALREIRTVWPRLRRPLLELGTAMTRNPWVAVAAWRRVPVQVPQTVRWRLTPQLMDGLHALARTMAR